MASKLVKIDSGVDPLARVEFVPEERWAELVSARQGYIFVEFTRDCRKLVEWVREAERMWFPLGYVSADDLITKGYGLEPEEIRLATRWLELNEPESAIGLPEVLTKAQQTALDNTEPVGQHGGDRRSQAVMAVAAAAAEMPVPLRDQDNETEKCKVDTYGNAASYRVRRLRRDCPEAAERLARGEFKSVAAAERFARGEEPHPPRKVPTPLDLLRRAWAKASKTEKDDFVEWIGKEGW
jgi:hypothetical protein